MEKIHCINKDGMLLQIQPSKKSCPGILNGAINIVIFQGQ